MARQEATGGMKAGMRTYDRKELLAIIPTTYVSIWNWMRDGKFPLPLALSNGPRGRVVWIADEVDEWLAKRPRRVPKKLEESKG